MCPVCCDQAALGVEPTRYVLCLIPTMHMAASVNGLF